MNPVDECAVETIGEASRGRYKKACEEFKGFSTDSSDYFKHLRSDKKSSSRTMWTVYSMPNTVCKGKYSERMQKFQRITALLKSFNKDCKKKAVVFQDGDHEKFFCRKRSLHSFTGWLGRW